MANATKADANLQYNTTILDWRIYNNITQLNASILLNLTQSQNQISNLIQNINNLSQIVNKNQNSIQNQNITIFDQQKIIDQLKQQITCTNNLGYQMVNGSCIQVTCPIQGQFSINGICQCTNINSFIQDQACVCPSSSVLVGNTCTCTQLGNSIVNNTCKKTSQVILNADNTVMCTQQVSLTTYEVVSTIVYSIIQSNFSSGYVFSSTTIQNALIDITDSTYSTVQPLFQSQSSFVNIVIQIGTQTLNGGSILSTGSQITINSVNIVSKQSTSISIAVGFQINILSPVSSNSIISSLLLNLTFALSQGNITLFGSITGTMDVNNYQINGQYFSTACVALLGISVSSANISLKYITAAPFAFNVGNYSALLLSNVQASTISIVNIIIMLGNSTNQQITNSITSTATNTYQFGGLITYVYNATTKINSLLINSNQSFTSNYVANSGLVIGNAQYYKTVVIIQNFCFKQQLNSTSLNFTSVGIFGLYIGNISIKQSSIIFNIQTAYLRNFGIIGSSKVSAIYSELIDMKVSVNTIVGTNSNGMVSSLVGDQEFSLISVQNLYVSSCNISSQNLNGCFIGYSFSSNVTIINSSVQNSNITSTQQWVGGLIGYSNACKYKITNVSVQVVRIKSASYQGIILGLDFNGSNAFTISSSWTAGNYVNDVQQVDCSNLTNIWSVTQCT
ncbi:Hypothetical_protein [Hexamita inflata]|uniref:Hypothetical_protein n=1 Tax=Hexamita inflata TaxID=28002 RepID=A0AA86PMS3_9EUKA|nr:Hypothetical protein HINF_LOCUS29126 [Hexamita inflata]